MIGSELVRCWGVLIVGCGGYRGCCVVGRVGCAVCLGLVLGVF